jgi:spore maturation protein CgeB
MKILLVAPKSGFTDSIKTAFESHGHHVTYLNERLNYLVPKFLRENDFLWRMLVRHSDALKLKNKKHFNNAILSMCKKEKFDILFTTKGTTISGEILQRLRDGGTRSVNWWLESMLHPLYKSWVNTHFDHFDHFLAIDSEGADDLSKLARFTKVTYVPMAVDPSGYLGTASNQDEKNRYECDVCFVGALYPERETLLKTITSAGVDLKIFGWSNWKNSSLAPYYHGPLSAHETAKVYTCSKVSVNSNIKPSRSSVNFKTFEIPASGGFQLTDDQADLSSLFIEGKEVAVYRSADDVRDKVVYYLNHETERSAIAKAGHERVLRDHTIEKRIGKILEIIS